MALENHWRLEPKSHLSRRLDTGLLPVTLHSLAPDHPRVGGHPGTAVLSLQVQVQVQGSDIPNCQVMYLPASPEGLFHGADRHGFARIDQQLEADLAIPQSLLDVPGDVEPVTQHVALVALGDLEALVEDAGDVGDPLGGVVHHEDLLPEAALRGLAPGRISAEDQGHPDLRGLRASDSETTSMEILIFYRI